MREGIAYCAVYREGLVTVDVSDPNNLVLWKAAGTTAEKFAIFQTCVMVEYLPEIMGKGAAGEEEVELPAASRAAFLSSVSIRSSAMPAQCRHGYGHVA